MSLDGFIRSHASLAQAPLLLYYGGSFNPWHEGHGSCVQLGSQVAPVIVIPDNNPQKQIEGLRTPLSEIEGTIRSISDRAFLFTEFFFSTRKTPTVEWMTFLRSELPQIEHGLLLGHDSFVGLDTWIDYAQILRSASHIFVVSRLDDVEKQHLKERQYRKLAPNLKIHFLGNHPHEHLSSTDLRSAPRR